MHPVIHPTGFFSCNWIYEDIVMKANIVSLISVATLVAAFSAGTAQAAGRDSVYAQPGGSLPSLKSQVVTINRIGRGSVTANDLPAPTPKERVRVTGEMKAGRA
jgi:hypothetical protein